MADKLTPLILDALARAAADPTGQPLHASKTEPGLFPASAAAKPAAQKCLTEGFLHVVRTDLKGKQARDLYAATDKGLQYLIDHSSPRQVLEDFVRVLEERRGEVGELMAAVERMADGLDGLRAVAAAVLPKVEAGRVDALTPQPPLPRKPSALRTGGEGEKTNPLSPLSSAPKGRVGEGPGVRASSSLLEPVTDTELGELLLTRLGDWASSAGVPQDCPLPELYRSLSTLEPAPSVGRFHDALRQLHADGKVYLHPWTGPLYALPEPAVALLVGHEVSFYASLRSQN